MMNQVLEKGATFIWNYARLLERALFDNHFRAGSPQRVLEILQTYQNEDGGFGQALEPDLRAPDSQPLFVEFALHTLHNSGLHAPEMVYRACDFMAQHSDLGRGIPTLFPSSQLYPRAAHWDNPGNQQPSMDRLVGLVGLANWQGVDHPWLREAVAACLAYVRSTTFDDAHTILTAFSLIESLALTQPVEALFTKLSSDLLKADYFILDAPAKSYGLTPLEFAPSPSAYCRPIFTDAQISAHLDDLQSNQQEDGGWPIMWQPPGEMAQWEWRGQKTLKALLTLRAYGRL